ncbi:MAG: hypothetical protein KDC18_00245 [Alphaproteobacteria bacterium]|nr:hypothetical protein [Alphaproteobacteria bacterium]MCB9928064.1 hypothetical protein [Alphaproteobacteria bacterium]
MRAILVASLIGLSAMTTPVLAETAAPVQDRMVLAVTEEAWVKTETARVIVEVKTLVTDAASRDKAANPTAVLDKVGLGEWHITGSHRAQTDTGYEQLLVVAEARLTQSALAGIYDRAKSAGEKGRTVRVLAVDFSPSLQEREATAAKLRQTIYARAAAEAKAVASQFPDRGFHVHEVMFRDGAQMPRPLPAQVRTMAAEKQYDAAAAAPPAQEPVSERMEMTARVIIASSDR